jgi:O-antigen/teichoic acid export membrane protein
VLSTTARWVTFGTAPLLALFVVWGPSLTLLFGPSFVVSGAVIAWLATGQFLRAVLAPSGWALSMTGKHVQELVILGAGLLIATIACVLAVPVYGALGAAIATCVATGMTNLVRVLVVRRRLGAVPFGIDLAIIPVTGIVLAVASDWLVALWRLPGEWHVVIAGSCFAAAYVIAIWLWLLTPAERNDVRTMTAVIAAALGRAPVPHG